MLSTETIAELKKVVRELISERERIDACIATINLVISNYETKSASSETKSASSETKAPPVETATEKRRAPSSRSDQTRICASCNVEKPLDREHFGYRRNRFGGFFLKTCRECQEKKKSEPKEADPPSRLPAPERTERETDAACSRIARAARGV